MFFVKNVAVYCFCQKLTKNAVFDGNHRRGPVILIQNLVQQPELKLEAQSGMDCLDLLLR